MLLDSDRNRLAHMVEAASQAMAFVEGRSRTDLDADPQLRMALLYALEVLGEASARVSPTLRDAHAEVPWSLAVSMRNRLIHAYFDINLDIVWKTVTEALPALLPKIQAILKDNRTETG